MLNMSPYPGLRPFKREEAHLFFGREEHTDQLLKKLAFTRFISVVGLSGCGKSSLTRAGMIAALESGYFDSTGSHWRVAEMHPGNQPLLHLAEALLADSALGPEYSKNFEEGTQKDIDMRPFVLASLRRGSLGLVEVIRQNPLPNNTKLLILVDQFEELFRYQEQENRDESDLFVALLLENVKQSEIPIYVVITMRSDFIGDCAQFQGLPEMINAGQFLVPRLTREQQRMAIIGPARVFGSTVEPRLANHLLNEMRNDPDQLPVLQHCLMRIWFQAKSRSTIPQEDMHMQPATPGFPVAVGVTMTQEAYDTVGGLENALSKHADEVFEGLDRKQQKIAETLFRCLSERSTGLRDIRRPARISEVAAVASVSSQEVIDVADRFRHPECCFIMPAAEIPLDADSVLDMSHESLIRQWDRLNKWVEQEAESAETYRRLEQTAYLWDQGKEEVLGRLALENTLTWKECEKPTAEWARRYSALPTPEPSQEGNWGFNLAMEFLVASEQAQKEKLKKEERERQKELELKHIRQQRIMFVILGVVLVIALLAVANFWIKAREQADIATLAKTRAEDEAQFARRAQQMAQVQKQNALKARDEAKRQARIARSAELAAQAQNVFEKYPQRSLLLAVEALHVTLQKDEPRVPAAEEVLREALANTGGRGLGVFQEGIEDMALSPDGQKLVIVNKEVQAAQVWNLKEDILVPVPEILGSQIKAVAIDSDSHWLFTGGYDKSIRLWDLRHEIPVEKFSFPHYHEEPVSRIIISTDNHWVVTNSRDNTFLWELKINNSTIDLMLQDGYGKDISAIAISPDNHYLVTGSYDGIVRLRDLENSDENPIVLQGHEDKIVDIAMSPDNHWLITNSYDGIARLWDLTVKDQVTSDIVLPGNQIKSVAISPNNHWLITGNDDGTVGLWDLTISEPTADPIVLNGHEGSVVRLDITSDSHWLVTSSEEGTVRLWDLTAADQAVTPLILRGHEAGISAAAISHDSHWLVTGSKDATARLWDLTASDPSATSISLPGHEGDVYTITISPDNHWVVTGSEDGTVRLWDLRATEPAEISTILYGHDQGITTVTVSQDSHWLVAGSEDNIVRLWDLTAADPASTSTVLLERDEALYPIAISPNKRWLVASSEDTTIQLWDLTSDSPPNSMVLHEPEEYISAVSFSADSHWLVTASGNDTIRLWDLAKDKPEATPKILQGHEENILTVALSSDKHWLITGSEDATARLWDLTADDPVATSVVLRGHEGAINTVVISADSRWLVTGSEDGTARLWMLQLDELIENACRTAGRNLSYGEWEKYFPGEKYRQTCPDLPVHWSVKESYKDSP